MKTRLISILYIFISALILISCQPSGTLTEDSQSNENANTPPLPKSESNYPTVISSTNGRRGVTQEMIMVPIQVAIVVPIRETFGGETTVDHLLTPQISM